MRQIDDSESAQSGKLTELQDLKMIVRKVQDLWKKFNLFIKITSIKNRDVKCFGAIPIIRK